MEKPIINQKPATELRRTDFYYELPQELIAQHPSEKRDACRLMVLHRDTEEIEHRHFYDVIDYLQKGDVLVINDSRVIPARIYGCTEGMPEKTVELLLLRQRELDTWECLVKPGKRARIGARLSFGDGILHGEVLELVEEGNRIIRFSYDRERYENLYSILHEIGLMPLPPYITERLADRLRARERLGCGTHCRIALYAGIAGTYPGKGGGGRAGDAPCGAWHLPPGQGRQSG